MRQVRTFCLLVLGCLAHPVFAGDQPAPPAKRTDGIAFAHATRPEPMVFMFMRNLGGSSPGPGTGNLLNQITRWQSMAHDRKRKVGTEWLLPKTFVQRRQGFNEHLKDAQDLARQLKKIPGETLQEKKQQQRLNADIAARMRQAARAWTDLPLRTFLLGIAELRAGQYAKSEKLLRHSIKDAPRIACFHQGRAMGLQGLNRHLDALEEMLHVLALRPDSQDALELVRKGMEKVPGYQIQTSLFRKASETVAQYEGSTQPRRSRGYAWLLPGKPVYVKDGTLPVPPCDRYTFLQGVAVPAATHALLVDRTIATGAAEMFVRIDETTLAPARVTKVRSYATRKEDVPLVLVYVDDYEFTPLEADPETGFSEGESVTIHGVSIYEEMGSQVRALPAVIESISDEGEVKLSASLVAGEGTAPVVTNDGRMVGFLTGRIDPMKHNGGPSRFITLEQLKPLLKRAERKPTGYSRYGRAKRKTPLRPAEGNSFIVYSTVAETFE